MSLLPFRKTRRLIVGSTNGVTAYASMLQAAVADGMWDWIATDPYGRAVVVTPNVLGTPSIQGWYRLNDANQAAGLVDSWGTAIGSPVNGAYTAAGVTYGVTGPHSAGGSLVASFNGTTGGASVALNLTAFNQITVEFWLNWTTFSANDSLALEFGTPTFQNVVGGFMVDPNGSTYANQIEISMKGAVGQSSWSCARPSAGAWHHYAVVLGFASPDTLLVYIDGALVSTTHQLTVSNAGTFASSTLFLMNRNLASLWAVGSLGDVVVYGGAVSAGQIAGHYAQR